MVTGMFAFENTDSDKTNKSPLPQFQRHYVKLSGESLTFFGTLGAQSRSPVSHNWYMKRFFSNLQRKVNILKNKNKKVMDFRAEGAFPLSS